MAQVDKEHYFREYDDKRRIMSYWNQVKEVMNVLTKQKNEKTIISVRNMLSRIIDRKSSPIRLFLKTIFSVLYRKAGVIVPNSQGLKEDLAENFRLPREKIEIVHNPCDVEKIREKSKEGIPDDESIECRGLLPYNGEEILQAYRNADIFVHPGIWFEPFNRTILEAPLANTAMVISDIGGPPEVFPDESLIFQRGNVDDLKQKLQRLIEDEELRQELAEKARKKTLDKYSPENTVSKIEKYYRSII